MRTESLDKGDNRRILCAQSLVLSILVVATPFLCAGLVARLEGLQLIIMAQVMPLPFMIDRYFDRSPDIVFGMVTFLALGISALILTSIDRLILIGRIKRVSHRFFLLLVCYVLELLVLFGSMLLR